MTSAAAPAVEPTHQPLLLDRVDWRTYGQLLKVFAERPGYRLTYDHGRLEIMPPMWAHDFSSRFLHNLVVILTEESELPLMAGGSTTLRRKLQERGIEADECYWIANARRMAGKRRIDLRTDPPPDLPVEVDVTRSSLDRLSIYAALRVPEVWRLAGELLTFHVLALDGTYAAAARSRSFPWLAPADLLPFLRQARRAGDQNPIRRRFRAWVRRHRASQPPRPRKTNGK